MTGQQVTIWYDRAGHWNVKCGDAVVRAAWVRMSNAVTDLCETGFMDLQPGGPRAVMRGELVSWEAASENAS